MLQAIHPDSFEFNTLLDVTLNVYIKLTPPAYLAKTEERANLAMKNDKMTGKCSLKDSLIGITFITFSPIFR